MIHIPAHHLAALERIAKNDPFRIQVFRHGKEFLFQITDDTRTGMVEIPLSDVARRACLTMDTVEVRMRRLYRECGDNDAVLDITRFVRENAAKARLRNYQISRANDPIYKARKKVAKRKLGRDAGRARANRTLAAVTARRQRP